MKGSRGIIPRLYACVPTALHLIKEWAIMHRDELEANWKHGRAGEPLDRIAPLD
jgi:hypothetical protein